MLPADFVIVEDLPDWCKRPDFETSVWLNGALEQLWPHLSAALSDKIGTVVGNILAKITPLGISLSFSEFTRTEPLQSWSVKKTGTPSRSSREEIILDLDVRWCGNPTVVLNVEIMGLPLKVRLNELQIVGPMRICLANFDDRLPCFHLMKVCVRGAAVGEVPTQVGRRGHRLASRGERDGHRNHREESGKGVGVAQVRQGAHRCRQGGPQRRSARG